MQTTKLKGQGSRSVCDNYGQNEDFIVDYPQYRRPEPEGCEDAGRDNGHLVGGKSILLNSTFNSMKPVGCKTVIPRTPGWTMECKKSKFYAPTLNDNQKHRRTNTVMSRRTPCTMESDSTNLNDSPHEDAETLSSINNLSKSSSDSDDAMAVYNMSQTIQVLQDQISKKKLKMSKKQRRRSILESTAM